MSIQKQNIIKDNWKNILLIVFFFITLSLVMSTTCTSKKLHIAENNISALTDTLNCYEMRNGELLYEKQGYILEKKHLEEYIGVCEKDIRELENKLECALSTISKMQAHVKVDTIHMTDTTFIFDDGLVRNDFTYNDEWLSLSGITTYNDCKFSTQINSIYMDVPLKIGTTKDNTWFATTENPYVSFSCIEGANLEKVKQKRFSLSIHAGVGLSYGYGISSSVDGIVRSGWFFGPAMHIGAGVSYKIFEF